MRAPSLSANASRNARAERSRHRRWQVARDALWSLLAPRLHPGMRVAVLGAGNADDLPLRRIVERGCEVALIDLDPASSLRARRRLRRSHRSQVEVIEHDVTEGAADLIVLAAVKGVRPRVSRASESPLPGGPFELVIGDLFYSQLLYPALLDLEVDEERREAYISHYAPDLVGSVVARLHASSPGGHALHIHDPLGWWEGHSQPISLEEVLRLASVDAEAATALASLGEGPSESDPLVALAGMGIEPLKTALWHWPFAASVDYLACATLVRCADPMPLEPALSARADW